MAEWQAYDKLSPIGEIREDYRISYLASLITNLVIRTNGKAGAKLTSVKDFLFNWDGEVTTKKGTQTKEEILSIFGALGANANKTSKSNGRKPKSLQK